MFPLLFIIYIAPSPTLLTINLSALELLLLLSPNTPNTRLSFFFLDNSIFGNASSMVIPASSYSIIHSLSVGFVSVAIFPVDITILPSCLFLNSCGSSVLNFSSSVKTRSNPVNVP
jgi:hypothetical protein